MKKIFTLFLLGQFLLFSIIFSRSIYEIYGLTHIGDTSLKGYKIEKYDHDTLNKLYEYLTEEKAKIQVIKMPISKESQNKTTYDIYHTNIGDVFRFAGLSDNQYFYHALKKEDFIDGTGVFYTDMPEERIQEICESAGTSVKAYNVRSFTSMKTILLANGVDLFVLLFITFGVVFIYVISRNKENAVKILLGFSRQRIVFSRMKETMFIQMILICLVVFMNAVYYSIRGRLSAFYIFFLIGFLCIMAVINVLLIFVTSASLKRTNVVAAIKNKIFTPVLDYTVRGIKIVLIILVSIAISGTVKYRQKISETQGQMEKYKELNEFYSSYGFNSDEYDKLNNDDVLYLEASENVKEMYREHSDNAYLMQDCVLTALDEETGMSEDSFYGMSREELFQSYEKNYIVVNDNYLRDYISPKIISGEIGDFPYTLLVPEKYSERENDILEHYKPVLEDKLMADNYFGKKDNIDINKSDIHIVYIEDDTTVSLLSDLQYESVMAIEIPAPIIILDKGNFAASIYMDMLSNCQLAFKLKSRDEYSGMLAQQSLEKLFSARTMMAPFMEEISGYQFMMEQSSLFTALFIITLLFIIYISNHIHIGVKSKQYAVKYGLGYGGIRILYANYVISFVLLFMIFILRMLKLDIRGYFIFVLIDMVMLSCLYRRNVVGQLYKILNGGF